MAKLKRYNGTDWEEVLDGNALGSQNIARPTNLNTISWHTPNGLGLGGYLEYLTGIKAGVTGCPGNDGELLNLGWDNGSWASQIYINQDETCHVFVRANTGTAGSYTGWKRLALINEIPEWSRKSDLSGAINTLTLGYDAPVDDDYYICQYVGGGETTTSYHRRKHSALWNYINGKIAKDYARKEVFGGYGYTAISNALATSPYVSNKTLVKMITIVVKSNYINCPITFELTGRGMPNSSLEVIFNSSDTTDPGLKSFTTTDYANFHIVKSATSTWDIYCVMPEYYANVTVIRMATALNSIHMSITYPMDTSEDALPDGAVQAMKKYASASETTGIVSSVVNANYPNNQNYSVTKSFLSYWNGAYSDTGASNLTYCTNGIIIGTNTIGNYVKNGKLTIQTEGTEKGYFTANSASDVTINIKASDLGLSGAMKFIGTTTSGISEGSDMQSILVGTETVTAETGNVVLKGDKEFIWTGSKWEELGDEQSHALKSITVKGTGILSGGGSLEANREITHNQTVRTDSSTMSATPGFGQSFTAIGGIGSDSYGHLNAVDTKTIVIPNTIASQSASGLMSASDKTKLDGIASGANNLTYALSSDGATVTLTPSSGEAQSVTVDSVANADYATRASKDYDGNIISSTYVKNTSDALLSGAMLQYARIMNLAGNFAAIPYPVCNSSGSETEGGGTSTVTYSVYSLSLGSYTLGNGIMSTYSAINTSSNVKSNTFPVRRTDFTDAGYGELGVWIPFATVSYPGLVKLYTTTKQTIAPNSVTSVSGKTYAVQMNSSNQLVVNVPWTSSSSAFSGTNYTKSSIGSSTATSYAYTSTTIDATSSACYLSVTGYETSQNGGMAIVLSTSKTAPAASSVNSSTAAALFEGQHGYWSYQAHTIGAFVPKGYYAHIYAYRMNTMYYHKIY